MNVAIDDSKMTGDVRVERSREVVTVTIDRPGRANSLDAATVEQLLEVLENVSAEDTRVLVLRSEGRHFCGGFDMEGVLDGSEGDLLLRFVRIEQLLQRLRRAPFLTVACVSGKAVGAGADIVAACGYRLLDPGTSMRLPGFRFGVALGTRHLAAIVGSHVARDLLLESRDVDASTALRLGLATVIVPREHQQAEVEKIVAATTGLDTPSVTMVLNRTSIASDADDAADMATLVTSLTRPGLRRRLAHYLDGARG
ncbi:enoyl-CoA hydratase/isomerase family protein [Rhodococcus sp. JS3073]|uniref:enoyl-CoA hydratase/isomerase family protein n=1 Tax=Rhodococcus sp. JS3073 TaxID=3002901 RepID=UPI002286A6C9|nr:enoyl-CoA hydratase/isomerase family protein [Rhodococcus sp. JS3073]WAM19423.1 enoyl-CoA hydratase/isomerase family protein [Rhodococcus sp. JS3073]